MQQGGRGGGDRIALKRIRSLKLYGTMDRTARTSQPHLARNVHMINPIVPGRSTYTLFRSCPCHTYAIDVSGIKRMTARA